MAHLSNKTWYNKQRPFVRLNGYGDIIPGSMVFRDRMPKQGIWRELGSINACCGGTNDSYLLVQVATASASITSIQSPDGIINYVGSITNANARLFVIPGGIRESVQFTVDTPTGRTLTVTYTDSTVSSNPILGAAINTTPIIITNPPNEGETSIINRTTIIVLS